MTDFTTRIVTRFEVEADQQNQELAEASRQMEALGRKIEKSTDGFDKLRSAVDATGDRLRIFGARGRKIADAIEDNIEDPVERARMAMKLFREETSRVPGRLDKLNTAFNKSKAQLEIFRARIGPLGEALAIGLAGAAATAAAAIGAELVKSVQAFIATSDKMQASVKRVEDALGRLRVEIGRITSETLGLGQKLDSLATALDTVRHLMGDGDTAAKVFRGTLEALGTAVNPLAGYFSLLKNEVGNFIVSVSTGIGPLLTLINLAREVRNLDPVSLANVITPADQGQIDAMAARAQRGSRGFTASGPSQRGSADASGGFRVGQGLEGGSGGGRRGGGGRGTSRLPATPKIDAGFTGGAEAAAASGAALASGTDATSAGLVRLRDDFLATTEAAAGLGSAGATSMQSLAAAVKNAVDEMGKDFITLGDVLDQGVKGALVGITTGIFESMGALALGQKTWGEFAASALNNLGQIAIQMGSLLIAAGAGFAVLPGFQASAAAIPAGVALVALGGTLTAISAGTSTGGGSRSGGAAATSSVAASLARDIVPRDESEGQMIALDINIAGESVERVIVPVMDDAIRRGRFRQLRPAFG